MRQHADSEAWRSKPAKRHRGFFSGWFMMRVTIGLIALAVGGGKSLYEKYFADSSSPNGPSEWSAEVAPIAAFVEAERGLEFDHPVAIDFLTEAEYVEFFSADSYEPTPEDVELYSQLSAVYDAAGLAVDLDLLGAQSTFTSVATLGVYVPSEDRIYIRGSELTPEVRVVLAHELTHALQQQHFTLPLGGPDDLSVRSIVEADALRVEDVYLASLPEAERAAAEAALAYDGTVTESLSTVPSAIVELNSAPYVLGPILVESVFASNGNEGVNELLRQPPTEEVLISPRLFGTTMTVAEPLVTMPPGATVIEDVEQLSMLDTLTLLDAWLPWKQARGAVDGWNGGGYVSYVRGDGLVCFTMNASFDGSIEPFKAAVEDWARAAGSTAIPTVVGGRVSFEACERGPAALPPPVPTVPLTAALYLEQTAIEGKPPESVGGHQCFARTLIDDPTVGPLLLKPDLTPDEQNAVTWVRNIALDACALS
jgi:hypothetical protein